MGTAPESRPRDIPPAKDDSGLVDDLLTGLAADDPDLADLLELACVPRTFDASLLAQVDGRKPDDEGFQAHFEQLLDYPFVHERGSHTWGVHERMRRPILTRLAEQAPHRLDDYLLRLQWVYDLWYAKSTERVQALAQVDELIASVSPDRYRLLRQAADDALVRSTVLRVATALRRSFTSGLDTLCDTFSELELGGLHRPSELLIRGWLGEERGVDPDDRASLRAWGHYFLARAANTRQRYEQALDSLVKVERELPVRHRSEQLEGWVAEAQAVAFQGSDRFDEAFAAYRRQGAIHQEFHLDDVNVAIPWLNQSTLHTVLLDDAGAIAAVSEALRLQNAFNADGDDVGVRVRYAQALSASGDLEGALYQLLHAIQSARLFAGHSSGTLAARLARGAVAAAVELVGPLSRQLLDTFCEQRRRLNTGNWENECFDLLTAHAESLLRGGGRVAALDTFAEARRWAEQRVPSRVWEADAYEGQYAQDLGSPETGIRLNLELLANPIAARDMWTRARAAHNGAIGLMAVGRYAEAATQAAEAKQAWISIGHHAHVVAIDVLTANAWRQLGRLDQARALLEQAPVPTSRPMTATLAESLAELNRAQARADEAASAALEALAAVNPADRRAVIRVGALAVDCLTEADRFADAAAVSEHVRQAISALADFVGWHATTESVNADEHAGRAVRIITTGSGSLAARTRSAREHLREAVGLTGSGWYQLELAWLELLSGDRATAGELMAAAEHAVSIVELRAALRRLRADLAD